jgi:hypothetical protein
LHGGLVPLPPIRNYSDAAKDPQNYPNYRVVTHPEKIAYASAAENVKIRVYPYMINPGSYNADTTVLSNVTMVVENRTPAQLSGISIEKITGNSFTAYTKTGAFSGSDYTIAATVDGASTVITLKNTPMRHPLYSLNGGLSSSQRLYGLEYIPSPFAGGFAQDLTNTTDANPKNTARWIITFPSGAFTDGVQTLTTRIGTDITTGTSANKPLNVSRTYVWINTTVPVTEQYQFIGDPRHNPYADVQSVNNYNWYHNAASAAYGYGKAQNGWGLDFVDADIPRFFQIYRKGLINSQALWSVMSGFGYYYYGLGGEIGSQKDPLPDGLSFVATPWSTTGSTAVINVDEMVSPHGAVNESYGRFAAKTNKSWYSLYMIGELFPDSEYLTNWSVNGNLPTGVGKYYRALYADGGFTTADWNYRQRQVRLQGMGASSFFNSVNAINKGPFKHAVKELATSSINVLGMDLSGLFNYTLPSDVENKNPWRLDETTNYPPEWNDATYSSQRVTAEIPLIGGVKRTFYDSDWNHPFHTSSGIVRISDSLAENAYLMASGINEQSGFPNEDMARYILAAMLRSFFDGGLYAAVEHKIVQVPRVEITAPSMSVEIPPETQDLDVSWQISWKRWNEFKYTFEYPDDYEDTAAENDLIYHMKYSPDNGVTWKFCKDGVLTEAGERSEDPGYEISHATPLPITWNIPTAQFPEGIYLLRVESFRKSIGSHYSYDQQKVFIERD